MAQEIEGGFDVLRIHGNDVLAVETVDIDGFSKSYLGEAGKTAILKSLAGDEAERLKPGWEKARFSVVSEKGAADLLGTLVEYPDGTVVLLTRSFGAAGHKESARYQDLIGRYLSAETLMPAVKRQKGWEEITPGAVIRESFTSLDTETGLWAKEVPVVDPEKCTNCVQCGIVCPEDAINLNPLTGKFDDVDFEYCKGCGLCAKVCPPNSLAITMFEKGEVKAAQGNVFTGIYGKRVEARGERIDKEVKDIEHWSGGKFEIVYEDRDGSNSLSGKSMVQVLYTPRTASGGPRPQLLTYFSEDGKRWVKIMRPLARVLVYGMSEYAKRLAAGLQLEGLQVTAIASRAGIEHNAERRSFEKAGIEVEGTLDRILGDPECGIDGVAAGDFANVTSAEYALVIKRVGVFLAPFMARHIKDPNLETVFADLEHRMPMPAAPVDDRPLAEVNAREKDIAAGHRACSGCPIYHAFNLAMKAVHELEKKGPEYAFDIANCGATGCAEVVTTIYPDTSWKRYLHTTFGGNGANLEGMNAAYRYLRKRGMLKTRFKFFGWAGDGGTYDIGLQALSGFLERGLATDSVYFLYDNGAYMNTGIQRSSATPMGAQTSTSPIGEVIPGKPQFRKDLARIAGAHHGVYVATVSPSHQMDFIAKLQKAALHDGPALIMCYSNCTTGHRTDVDFTMEQSAIGVESGYWPLFEIENGETRITHTPSAFNLRQAPGERTTLIDWVRSEGRFAMHFDKKGDFRDSESGRLFKLFEKELLNEWRKLVDEDKATKKKDGLKEVLLERLRDENAKRAVNTASGPHPFGIQGYSPDFVDEFSWFGADGGPKDRIVKVIAGVFLGLDFAAYDKKDPELKDKLFALFMEELASSERINSAVARERAAKSSRHKGPVEGGAAKFSMDEDDKAKNRAALGNRAMPGRIFARAGDGGVTAAKLFVSFLKEIGIFGKAAPDYGPERRGAPVGTNFTISGSELRTQAGFDRIGISIVANPGDLGWSPRQWCGAVEEGGVIVVNTPLSPDDIRRRFAVPETVSVATIDASAIRKNFRVPETVTLLGAVLSRLCGHDFKGLTFPKEYLAEKWEKLLAKEFADKANCAKIVKSNVGAFWKAFDEAQCSVGVKAGLAPKAPAGAGFETGPPDELMTGSEAVAEAWRQINPGVFAMFPITPSTEVGQVYSQFWADGGVDTEFVHTESEHSSFMTIIAAAAAGVRAVTSTASQGMLLGKEGGLLAASLNLPVVVNVGARETNAPLSIHAGHTDFMQFRDDGWLHFVTRNAQEAYDFALIAQKAAEKAKLPAFIIQDGFIVTHTKDMLAKLSDEQAAGFVGEYDPAESLLKSGGTYNPISLQDYYSEHVRTLSQAQKLAPGIVAEVFKEFAELSGREYRPIKEYRLDDAEVVVVAMGSTEGTAMDAVDELRVEGMKAGLLAIKVYRPFPAAEIRKALAKAKTIIVMDRANAQGIELTPLAIDVRCAVMKPVLNLEYGRGGRNTPTTLVKEIYRLGAFLGGAAVKRDQVQGLIAKPDRELKALIEEMKILEGPEFVESFLENVRAGNLLDAFGPREHIDVRETAKRREIKLRVITKLVGTGARSGKGEALPASKKPDRE